MKPCKVCGNPFEPKSWRRQGQRIEKEHCSDACKWVTARAVSVERRSRRAEAAFYARLQAEFGTLSARDLALVSVTIKQGIAQGYQQGYHKGYATLKPRKAVAA